MSLESRNDTSYYDVSADLPTTHKPIRWDQKFLLPRLSLYLIEIHLILAHLPVNKICSEKHLLANQNKSVLRSRVRP